MVGCFLLQPDVVMLMQACMSACFKIGLIVREPTPEHVMTLAAEVFHHADTNLDGHVAAQEFFRWAR